MAKIKKRERVSTTPPAKYTEQIVLLVSADARAVIDVVAREQGLSQAAVGRALLYAGMQAAGYHNLKTTDEPGNLGRATLALQAKGLVG